MIEQVRPGKSEPASALSRGPRGIKWLARLSGVEKAYLLGMALLIVAMAGLASPSDEELFRSIGRIGGLVLTSALACEAYRLIVRIADATWAKWLMAPILVMGGALAVGEAARVVNTATGQDPDLFPRATTFMVPIAALPLLGLLAIALSCFAIIAFMFTWGSQLSSRHPEREARAWFWFARMVAAFASIVFVSPTIEANSSFHVSVHAWAATMARGLDMHIDRRCGPAKWERVRRINDELVLVARRTSTGALFRRESCPLAPD